MEDVVHEGSPMNKQVVTAGIAGLVVGALIGGLGVRILDPGPSFLERSLAAIESQGNTAMFQSGRVQFAGSSVTYVQLDTVRGSGASGFTAGRHGMGKEPVVTHSSTFGNRRSAFKGQLVSLGRIEEKKWAATVKEMGRDRGEATVWFHALGDGALWTGFECYQHESRSYVDGRPIEHPGVDDLAGWLAASKDMALRTADFLGPQAPRGAHLGEARRQLTQRGPRLAGVRPGTAPGRRRGGGVRRRRARDPWRGRTCRPSRRWGCRPCQPCRRRP